MLKNKIIIMFSIILLLILIIGISPVEMQNDTFWSIKVGERLFNEGIFGIDNFSIHENLYYIAHHFLTDILFFLIYNLCGFKGLYIFEVFFTILIAVLLYFLNNEIVKNKIVCYFLTLIQIFLFEPYIAVRAQMVSYVLFIIELILLEKYKKNEKRKYLVTMSIIPLFLVNLHMGTVPLFFVFLIVNIIGNIRINFLCFETVKKTDKKRIKELLIVLIVGVASIFINPYGVNGVIYPFKTFANQFINSTIQEFQPYNIVWDGGVFIACLFLIMLLLILNNNKKIKFDDAILMSGIIIMSFKAIRYYSFFVISLYITLRYVDGLRNIAYNRKYLATDKKALIFTFYIVIIILICLIGTYRILNYKNEKFIPDNIYPTKAVNEFKKYTSENSRVFNEYSWGSYLIMNNFKVYIDSRCDFYTKEYSGLEIADDYNNLMNCKKEYNEIIEKYNLNTFIIPSDCSFAVLLDADIKYNKVYEDEIASIFLKITH